MNVLTQGLSFLFTMHMMHWWNIIKVNWKTINILENFVIISRTGFDVYAVHNPTINKTRLL